jgi:hypothetical protein
METNWEYIKKIDWIDISDELPEKGKDIEYISSNGSKGYAFRCACPNPNCREWRCTVTGYGLIINVIKWKYYDKI